MFYRTILKKSLIISWRHKSLWLFGFFVALFFGNGGVPDLLFQTGNISEFPSFIIRLPQIFQEQEFREFLINFQKFYSSQPFSFSLFFLLSVLIIFFFIWLAIVSYASLIGAIDWSARRSPDRMEGRSLIETFNQGKKYFLSLFSLNLLVKLFIFGLLILVNLPLILLYFKNTLQQRLEDYLLNFSVLSTFIILIFLNIIISFLILYAAAFIVLKHEKVFSAIKKAWQLFIKNWLISLEMAFILFIINFLASLILLLVLALFSLPFIFLAIISYAYSSSFSFSLVISLALILLIISLIFFVSFLSVFQVGAWVLLFGELCEKRGVMSKLIRLFEKN